MSSHKDVKNNNHTMGVKYTVDGQKVTAKITGCEDDFYNLLNKWFKGRIPDWFPVGIFSMPNEFEASANCSCRDTFNENVGKELAKHYVLNKYNRALHGKVRMLESMAENLSAVASAARLHMDKRDATANNRSDVTYSMVHESTNK